MEDIRLTVAELAGRWKVHKNTIYALVRTRQVPHFRVGQQILFRLTSIRLWEEKNESEHIVSNEAG